MDGQPYDAVIDSPIGRLGIRLHNGRLRQVKFLGDDVALQSAVTPAADGIVAGIRAYFKTGLHANALDIEQQGTEFQRRVWKALCTIPAGQVTTYGVLAEKLGSSARAVGNACRCNPVPILVPCHRVVARNGLGGFAGDRDGRLVDIKRFLLAHEGVEIDVTCPNMA